MTNDHYLLISRMDISAALTEFPEDLNFEAAAIDQSGDGDDEKEVTRTMVAMQNKKKKKSGGFQSMGMGRFAE